MSVSANTEARPNVAKAGETLEEKLLRIARLKEARLRSAKNSETLKAKLLLVNNGEGTARVNLKCLYKALRLKVAKRIQVPVDAIDPVQFREVIDQLVINDKMTINEGTTQQGQVLRAKNTTGPRGRKKSTPKKTKSCPRSSRLDNRRR